MDFPKYLIVGTGPFGCVLAERITKILKEPVLMVEKRNHIGGNCYSTDDSTTGIHYHLYGTHIFHTSNEQVWEYINRFTSFNHYVHQVLTTYKDKVYQMPINLETINTFYGLNLRPYEVDNFLAKEIIPENITVPRNFEEKAISLVGRQLYEAFIRGYTMKQWQVDPKNLPAQILNRLPFRKNYNENYYFSKYQGIPIEGYGKLFKNMLRDPLIKVLLDTDFFDIRSQIPRSTKIIYSGPLDQFYNYKFGKLQWRTLKFQHEIHSVDDFQGTSVMNYADFSIPYTRIHEPKHLHPEKNLNTGSTLTIKEYSQLDENNNPYYPINDSKNTKLAKTYHQLAMLEENVIMAGRLGSYRYYDMHETIQLALEVFEQKILSPLGRKKILNDIIVTPS